jgi:hypothetical protein
MAKKRCPADPKHHVISWGKNSSGTRRFRCLNCQRTFTWKQSVTYYLNSFTRFERWLNGANVSTLGAFSMKSNKTIRKSIHWFLDYPPLPQPKANLSCHLVIDATWFGRNYCFLIYWDADLKHAQWWRYSTSESSYEIIQDLIDLKKAEVICSSITSDGGTGIRKAVDNVYSHIPHQRCIIHVQRLGLALLTRNPRTLAGQELRSLIKTIAQIENKLQRDEWVNRLLLWCSKWDSFLKERSYFSARGGSAFGREETGKWWYTHKSLRRAKALILNALPNLFHYLEDNTIPKDTNGLEGRFSMLKQHYRQHRGLSKLRRKAYLAWYVTMIINKKKQRVFTINPNSRS